MTGRQITRLETVAVRVVMILMAVLTASVGIALLTTPLAVPVAVGLWLGAAAMLGLGIWGRLPDERSPT